MQRLIDLRSSGREDYRFKGHVRELFGYREFLFTDHFSFGLHVSQTDFDHVVMISDPQRELRDVIEENMVVEVSVVCLYGHSFVVDPLVYSPFNFRGFTIFAVVQTTLYYVPENSSYERRVVEFEMDVDE